MASSSTENYLFMKKDALTKFMRTYEKEYKKIKEITHKCQYECYGREELSRDHAEECARRCLKPYIMQRKVNEDLIQKCEVNFSRDEMECRQITSNNIQKECLQEIIPKYDECLQKEAPKVKKCVGEYIKVFDNIVHGKVE